MSVSAPKPIGVPLSLLSCCKRSLQQWLPRSDEERKEELYLEMASWSWVTLLSDYLSLVRKESLLSSLPNREERLLSGLFCYIGSLLLHPPLTLQDKARGRFASFTYLYLVIDTYLDQPQADGVQLLNRLTLAMEGKASGIDGSLLHHYRNIACESTMPYLRDLLACERSGVDIQREGGRERRAYLDIAQKKGAATVAVILSLVGIVPDHDSDQLGAAIQLVDDLLDLEEDERDAVHTIATHDKRNGKLDLLLCSLIKRVGLLSPRYNLCKSALLTLLLYTLSRTNRYHPTTIAHLSPYLPMSQHRVTCLLSMLRQVVCAP